MLQGIQRKRLAVKFTTFTSKINVVVGIVVCMLELNHKTKLL